MRNLRIRYLAGLLTAVMIISMFAIPGIPAQSASKGITTIRPDTVYTTLDVTGNGKKDRWE